MPSSTCWVMCHENGGLRKQPSRSEDDDARPRRAANAPPAKRAHGERAGGRRRHRALRARWRRRPSRSTVAVIRCGGHERGRTKGMATVTGASGTESRPSPLGVGVVVWLASELMFFSGLFAAYFTLRATDHPWPPLGVELATGRTAIATVVLVASSFTMHLASRAASANRRATRRAMARDHRSAGRGVPRATSCSTTSIRRSRSRATPTARSSI